MEYLFQRRPSPNWSIRLQTPGGKAFEKSLGTPDRKKAEVIALEKYSKEIAVHKAVLADRPRLEIKAQRRYEPGLHDGPDGERIHATETELRFYSADNRFLRAELNTVDSIQLASGVPLTLRSLSKAFIVGPRPAATEKTGDDAIIQTYLDHGGRKNTGVHGYFRREAEAVWALFRALTGNKPLAKCTRDDGRLLIKHFQQEGLKSATIQKKITWLNAAVAFAIKESRFHSINPFSGIAPDGDDEQERLKLSDADMKVCKSSLDNLSNPDQLLFRVLATTGMRLSEAFEIGKAVEWEGDNVVGELKERGVRYVIVGHKTKQSKRRVPFPAGVLPYLPKAIKGPLFTGTEAAASKRLNRFLRDIGVVDPRKVVHSLRHRAQDRLRAAECPQDMRWALLGHEEKTVAEDYGTGFSVPQLKRWVDTIGF